MCIAILNTKKAGSLPKSYIKNSWDNNNMGAGLLWVENGELKVFKSYNYSDYEDMYYLIRKDKNVGNIVLHFRIATSGYSGEHNLHPFLINKSLGFVHNGVIAGLGNKQFSDTYEFNELLKGFKHNFLKCDTTRYFISNYIGGSKLLFLDEKDKYYIINEEKGHWKDDNWFSNNSYESYNDFYYYGNTKVSKTKTKYDADFNWNTFETNSVEYTPITDDEWGMYEDVCDIYGLDPDDDESLDLIYYYMELNECEELSDLWHILYEDYNINKQEIEDDRKYFN